MGFGNAEGIVNIADLGGSVTPVIAVFALALTIRAGIFNKRADIILELYRRFDALTLERHALERRLRATGSRVRHDELMMSEVATWAERFWNLQIDQYEFWCRGLIDEDLFRLWMRSRQADYMQALATGPDSLAYMVYVEHYRRLSALWPERTGPSQRGNFKEFATLVRSQQLALAMKKHRANPLCRWGLWT